VIYDESQPAAYQNHTDVDNNLQTEQHSTNYEPNDVWPSSEPVSWPTQQANVSYLSSFSFYSLLFT
jgi:hypothetical protein